MLTMMRGNNSTNVGDVKVMYENLTNSNSIMEDKVRIIRTRLVI